MAHPHQLSAAGKRNYAGSPLAQRNDKLRRAAAVAPVRAGDAGCDQFASSTRTLTAAEYLASGDAVDKQLDADREPHLLVRDPLNDGEFLPVAIYDVAIEQERGLCEFDLHGGSVLVKPDTLIYFK
jgi:hypothetical protein